MSVAVVIPAFNASRHLRAVLWRVARAGLPDLERIIVVNDGSSDDTREQYRGASSLGCALEAIERTANGGYGAAMKDGLARARANGADVVACVHADGQYAPEVLPRLVSTLRQRELDLLQGSRVLPGTALAGGMPLYKYAANAGLNVLENLTLGLGLSDYHSGYLVYGRRTLERVPFDQLSNSFDFDLEVIASAHARGLAIAEAAIPTHYGDEISHLRPIRYGLRVLRVLWNYKKGVYDPS
jgi:glycosyltransferase involved in cell wall biosynthesis